ncbi:uncharacterized protein LOC121371148 isoform X1 [Gigantopelta aegis]|uniref:uncharacterized protein LOC121371148 isoform X1 n=1 Tax=Gigantopelta aegis TaxID=1735272 RepID=UPI001B88E009|nr:uncharacterized protein LOC121371148 isoform X1 [Gigantopelta aegis]XP_041352753.1 uncharacterized protein LOC121371148 isoform X1 [Gigantopelta aegis]
MYLEQAVTKRLHELAETPSSAIVSDKTLLYYKDENGCNRELKESIQNREDCSQDECTSIVGSKTQVTVKPQCKISLQCVKRFSTMFSIDKYWPVVKGMAVSDKTILISDNANHKIKHISLTGVLKFSATSENISPYAIAVCKGVLGVIHKNYLYLFSEDRKLMQKILLCSMLPIEKDFTVCLANYRDEGFIVGYVGFHGFRVYDTCGKLMKKIPVQLSYPLAHLSVTGEGNFLVCEWRWGNKSVRVLTPEGEEVTRCKETQFWRAHAACVDRNGLIYAVDMFASSIWVFDKAGTRLLCYAAKRDELTNPVNLAFDDDGLLYVVNYCGDINVYKTVFK